uniref:Uncharacterized protein n=1 Tax=Quercus lobata TaxID=97700 RepID=A0A7N2R0L4_QUELO
MGQEKSMRDGGEDLILRLRPAPLPSLHRNPHKTPTQSLSSHSIPTRHILQSCLKCPALPNVLLTACQNLTSSQPNNALNSQSLLNSDSRRFDIEEMGRQVCENRFDIEACCVTMMPSRKKGESLVLSNLKLKVLIEAIRMVLEILYDERFVTFFLWWACLYGTPHRH